MRTTFLGLLLVGGCARGSESNLDGGIAEPTAAPETDSSLAALRLDVYPSSPLDADGTAQTLPQSFSVTLDEANDVVLRTPTLLTGVVVGFVPNPFVADLPGSLGPASSTVEFYRPGTVQTYGAQTEVDGTFEVWAVPDRLYQVRVVPTDGRMPFFEGAVDLVSEPGPLSFELTDGHSLYGQVVEGGRELQGVSVFAVSDSGVVTATTTTDSRGLYTLAVPTA